MDAARDFSGVNEEIRCALGACNLTGALTLGAMFVRHDLSADALVVTHNSSSSGGVWFRTAANSKLSFTQATAVLNQSPVVPVDTWMLALVTKPAGTATPRFHIYDYATGTWAHENATGALANAASHAGGSVRFGERADVDDFNGVLQVAGIWTSELADADCEALTDDLDAWEASAPSGLWCFNQAAVTTAVADLTGNGADQTARTGTTVVAGNPDFAEVGGTGPALRSRVRLAGVFSDEPVLVREGGVFVEKPVKVRAGGAFA